MVYNAREIKLWIKSAKNIAQITKAMEMVSAAKMKKAQARLGDSAPYAMKLHEMISTLASFIGSSNHPLLYVNPHPQNAMIVLMTSNRGLCGALNGNIFRESYKLAQSLTQRGLHVAYTAIGRKGRDFLKYTRRNIVGIFDGFGDTPRYRDIQPISHFIIDAFLSHSYDEIYFVYPQFVSTLTQHAVVHRLLPVLLPDSSFSQATTQKPIFEPGSDELLHHLLPYYVEQELFHFILQSNASEHSARMIAMKNAHDNATEVRKELTLAFNSARQAQITQQIAEIASATMV